MDLSAAGAIPTGMFSGEIAVVYKDAYKSKRSVVKMSVRIFHRPLTFIRAFICT